MLLKQNIFSPSTLTSMHREILTKEQIKLLPLAGEFIKNFGLVGGTAIALQIGHRRSIDFDLFTFKHFDNARIREVITKNGFKIGHTRKDEVGQFTFLINQVQFTFLHYPFEIKFSEQFEKFFKMPDMLTLAAMKAYALGRRAKWKDYVDLFSIINQYHSIKKIITRSKEIFAGEFNEKIFREQLCFFDDIDYSENIEYMVGRAVKDAEVKKQLVKFAVS